MKEWAINKISNGYQVDDGEYNPIFATKKEAWEYIALIDLFWKEYIVRCKKRK